MSDLLKKTITELRASLDSKQITAEALAQECLGAAQKHEDLNCFISINREQIISDARNADKKIAAGEKAPLLGVPVSIKDLILTQPGETTAGSKILKGFKAPYEATVVKKLRSAGAIIFGKTNHDEFGMGTSNENSAFGSVKNPWNTAKVPGGSSGGSAACVAACITPASLGTDTGGSCRQPASLCGIIGYKPTYGRNSRYGVVAFASSLDQVGIFTRTIADLALVAESIAGQDLYDSTTVDKPVPSHSELFSQDIKGLRIGVPKEYFVQGVSAEVATSVNLAISKLNELGAEIVDISLPNTEVGVATYYILAPAEAASNLARYDGIRYGHRAQDTSNLFDLYCKTRSEGFGEEVKRRIIIGTYVLSSGYYDAFYLKAQRVRKLIQQDFELAFKNKCDLIACPTAPTTAFNLNDESMDPLALYLQDALTIPTSLAGLPGVSIPCGFDSQGLPIGLQLIGQAWKEPEMLHVGHAFQQATDWHKKFAPIVV
ncbi:MAG: Asp-tRNA(Asn)/Glu-tRNA(Gln) amidotransferase subunit GatA [Bdellovibrionales bacterium]|nr:Asp-tRNA(Asn)/Glu-tRNA(Gln) amidotransferase subunit GatA [Bdellovibrionales bacterium]